MAEIVQDENPRKSLYRLLLADKTPGVGDRVKKYSFPEFENRLLTDQDTQNKMGWYLESKGIVADPVDFSERYLKKAATQVPPAPKPEPAPVAIEEEEAYVPEPQPLVGSPEYDKQLQKQYGGMAPTLGATFAGTPAAFETKAQKEQEQISPVFKAQQLAFEDVPIAEEQRRAQKQFAKATKQQQQAALRGGTGFELQQERADEARDSAKYLKDFGSYIGATFDNVIDKTKAAERMFGAKQKALLTFGDRGKKAEQEEKKAKQDVYNYISQLDQEFAAKQADYNIEGNLFEAIRKGQWDRIPEAFAYNIAQVGIQALAAANTGGYSMFAQVVPDIYKSGVEEIAKKTKTTPEQVIASGNDRELLSYIGGAVSGYIEKLSGGILGQAMKSQGAYKFLRDKALDKIGKTKWKQAAASAAALGGVSGIEGVTELGQGLVEVATPQVAAADTFKEAREKIYQELQKPETQRRLAGEFVGGAAGGGGIAAGGRGLSRVLEGDFTYGDVRKAPQRADYDVVQIDNKIQERNKIAQAMEEAVKANPEAEGQIRQQYQKRINEAAPADEEVLSAYENIAQLPDSDEKTKIQQNLTAYMTEKGIVPEAEAVTAEEVPGEGYQVAYAKTLDEVPEEYRGSVATIEKPTTRLGRFGPTEKLFAYRIPTETIEVAPEEEAITEEIPFEEAPIEEEIAPIEEAPATSGMFEGLAGPQAEEEVVAVAPVKTAPVTAEEEIVEAVPAPAPKGRKKQPAAPKSAPVVPPAPKAQPAAEKKEEKPAPKAEPKEEKPTTGMPEEGSKVNLPPQSKYTTDPRKMVFKDGEWKQEVGGQITSVGEAVQQQAQEAFSMKTEVKAEETKEAPKGEQKPIEFGKQLEQKYGVRVDLLGRLDKGDLTLSRIEVPKGQREKGIGTKVMEEIINYADENGKRIVLSPTKEFGATSVDRLRAFYKGFGFVENKGNNKDFTIKELMYRLPSQKEEVKPVAETKGGAKESLSQRLKGDALLDAEDTLAELSDNGATINPDGTVVVYHRTSKEKADAIVKNNEMFGLEDGVFFSTSEKGQAEGYGDVVVKMNVPIEQIQIDDTFGNEAHVRIPTKKANQKISVAKFSPQLTKAEEVLVEPLTEQEEEITKEINISENEAATAKQSSPKRTRKSKSVTEAIEREATDVESSGSAERAEEVIEAIEAAENVILTNAEVDESFDKKYEFSALKFADDYNLAGKRADLYDIYKSVTGKELDTEGNSYRPSEKAIQFAQDLLSALGREGIKLKTPLGIDGITINVSPSPVKPFSKTGTDALQELVSKDDMRPSMQGVYFDGDNMVATNAFILTVQKKTESDREIIEKAEALLVKYWSKNFAPNDARQIASKTYEEIKKNGLNGKIINTKTGEVIDQKYPDYQQIIPQENQNKTAPTDVQELINLANGANLTLSNNNKEVKLIVFLIKGKEQFEIGLDTKLFKDLLQSMQGSGTKKVTLEIESPNKGILIKGDNGSIGLIMPVMIGEEIKNRSQAIPLETKPAPKAPETKGAETKPAEFTSSQSSEAATAFDKAKTSKNFDKKYGKGAYKILSDITKNFEDIMDGLSEKIKQDCL
jgi:predicted GNAT family acetyltransferase